MNVVWVFGCGCGVVGVCFVVGFVNYWYFGGKFGSGLGFMIGGIIFYMYCFREGGVLVVVLGV